MIYITVEEAIFNASSDEFLSVMTKTVDEACNLIEVGLVRLRLRRSKGLQEAEAIQKLMSRPRT